MAVILARPDLHQLELENASLLVDIIALSIGEHEISLLQSRLVQTR